MATAVQSPSSHPHTSYRLYSHHHNPFSSSHSSTPRSTLQKHSSSYRTISSGAAMASYSSYASSTGGARPGSSYESQPQHLHGKLHKRSISKETSVSVPSPTEEEFFPADPSHHKKGLIKPLALLKKVGSSSSGKLDLGKENGGAGGVYYSSSSPYIGGRSSATDVASFVPTHRQQHKRTISGTSANSGGSVPNAYGRRYAPTPTQSYPNSIGGDSESADDDEEPDYVGGFGRQKSIQQQQQSQGLKIVTSSTGLPLTLPPRIPISESAPISPVTPIARSMTVESFDRKRNDSIDKKRKDSIDRKRKIVGGRNSSEEYVESMKKAREKFEELERKKDEKEERKARKSISKEERRRSISKEESRRPSNDGTAAATNTTTTTTTSNPISKPRWTLARHSTPELGTSNEKTIGVPYTGASARPASNSLRNVPMRAAEEGRRSRNEKRGHHHGGVAPPRGFKNQWQGFVMWVQIGFVKMGRKVRRLFEKK
ncbi:hypothetical protein AA313_de0200159 [Arthrobotrys entomopaga]|nr:hypothetical protein AA313_de0200159 [Arthrobotrys entomopaga]